MGNHNSAIYRQDPESINLIGLGLTSFPSKLAVSDLTKYLYISGNKLKNLPRNLEECLTVDLAKNQIGPDLPDDISKPLSTYSQLIRLILSNNQLTKLNQNLRCPKLQTLILSQNRFNFFPPILSSNFESLSYLHLDTNFLTELSNININTLTVLTLSMNNIELIDTSTIHLPNLRTLNISKNKIKQIPDDFSKSFPALVNLDLSDNFIKGFPANEHSLPPTLEVLTIYSNQIDLIPGYFKLFKKLRQFSISNNKLTYIPELPTSLQDLKINDNKISSFAPQHLPDLKILHMYYNELEEFQPNVELPSLDVLLLDHNKLSELSIHKSFSEQIGTIDISFNHITSIPKEVFLEYHHLTTFICSFNNITEIPPEISQCHHLYELTISHNPIKHIPRLPHSLLTLSAANCELETADNVFFDETIAKEEIHIKNVCLSGNKITSFPYIPSIQLLYLSNNQMTQVPQIGPNLKVLDLSLNQISSNDIVIDGPALADLNLAFNNITKMPTLSNCPLLQSFRIDNNQIEETTVDLSKQLFLSTVSMTNTNVQSVKIPNKLLECLTSSRNVKIDSLLKPHYIDQHLSKHKHLPKSAFSEITGLRPEMEDSIIVRDDLGLYAVCDGHGGPNTAIFSADTFSELFQQVIQQQPDKIFTDNDITTKMSSIYSELETRLQKQHYPDGSTLCLGFIFHSNDLDENNKHKRKLLTAHIGDARALIVERDGTARDLTVDHKPTMRSEFERVHKIYGTVVNDRIDGLLAVARSIGDFNVYGVGHEPEINIFDLTESDRYLIICCDGVFDVLSNDEVALVVHTAKNPIEAAFRLRNSAYGIGSADNISVIVVDLEHK